MQKNIGGKLLIKRLMLILAVVILVIEMFFLSSCGVFGWTYELPNHYCVDRDSEGNVRVIKEYGKYTYGNFIVTIEPYITCFAYNERYICAMKIDLNTYGDLTFEEIDEMAKNNEKLVYSIVDTETDNVYDLLTEQQYNQLLSELNITNLCDWIGTDKKPEGAYSLKWE